MKAIMLSCLLLAAAAGHAQTKPALAETDGAYYSSKDRHADNAPVGEKPFKGANTILVYTNDSARVAIKRVAQKMQEKGFVIERLDYDLLSVSTKPKVRQSLMAYQVSASAIWLDGVLILRGQWHAVLLGNSTDEPAAYTDPSSRAALAELHAIAEAYPGGQIKYEKR
jgi:hypothetical protein